MKNAGTRIGGIKTVRATCSVPKYSEWSRERMNGFLFALLTPSPNSATITPLALLPKP